MSAIEGGLQVSLHPLPILNISEHLTRVSLQTNNATPRIVGGLLGIQIGRSIEIMNTFELVIKVEEDGTVVIDKDYFGVRKDQFKQVFPTFDFLGWYSVGEGTDKADMDIHQQFFEYNETPLFLQLSPSSPSTTSKVLPIQIFESNMEIIGDKSEMRFVKLGYEIETGEAERVAVDHVSKAETGGAGSQSGLIATLTTQRNAIKMLHDRVSIILLYLSELNAGKVELDQETLRQIGSLIVSIPALNDGKFQTEFMTEYNDVLLTTYLASMTKELNSVNELLDKQLLLVAGNQTSNNSGSNMGRMLRRGGKGMGSMSSMGFD